MAVDPKLIEDLRRRAGEANQKSETVFRRLVERMKYGTPRILTPKEKVLIQVLKIGCEQIERDCIAGFCAEMKAARVPWLKRWFAEKRFAAEARRRSEEFLSRSRERLNLPREEPTE